MSEFRRTLGIKEPASAFGLVEAARNGLKKEALDNIAEALEIGPAEMGRFLHVSPRTIHRYKPGQTLSLDASDHILQIAKVYERTVEVLGEGGNAVQWLKASNMALGGAKPIDLLDTSPGIEMVITILGRIEYGVYS